MIKKETILILGGTQMVGRDFVETIQNTNPEYYLYLANRGITNKSLFPHINTIIVDRNNKESCSILSSYVFDIVIDFSCYNVKQYLNVIDYLKYKKYILISTQSVMDSNTLHKKDLNDPYYWYCFNKKELEDYIKTKNTKTIIVRPGAIYGENDYTNRFEKREGKYYWKNTNIEPTEDKGCIYIKKFTSYLIQNILLLDNEQTQILQIP